MLQTLILACEGLSASAPIGDYGCRNVNSQNSNQQGKYLLASPHSSFIGSIPENYDTYLGPLLFEFTVADMAARMANILDRPARVLEAELGKVPTTMNFQATVFAGYKV